MLAEKKIGYFATLILSMAMLTASMAMAADKPFYEVKVKTTKVDGKSMAVITVKGTNGYHCNLKYPWKLTVKLGEETKIFKKADAKAFLEKNVIFQVPYTEGQKTTATLKLSLCNDVQCKMEKVPLSW